MKLLGKFIVIFFLILSIISCDVTSANAFTLTESKIYSVDEYDCVVQPFGSKLVAVKVNGKWGFMDSKGNMAIKAIFEEAHNFTEGLAPVLNNGKWGYINTNGDFLVSAQYDEVAPSFHDGYVQVAKKGKWGIIDKNGKVVIPLKYQEVNSVGEGLTAVKIGKQYGFVNSKNKLVIPAKFEQAYMFQNGLAPVKNKGKWGYINKSGKLVIPYTYIDAESFVDHFARVVIQKGTTYYYGVINTKGKKILETKYYQVLALNEGIAPYVYTNEQNHISMGYISLKTRKTIFKLKNLIEEFSEGYAFGGIYSGRLIDAVYDKRGAVTLLKNKYYKVSPFNNGYSIATVNFEETSFRIIHKK